MSAPNLFARFAAHRRSRRAADELSALSDRDLADIGICRMDIERVSRIEAKAPASVRSTHRSVGGIRLAQAS